MPKWRSARILENLDKFYEDIHKLVVLIWNNKIQPEERKESIIFPTDKKGDKMDCNNYRATFLLSI